MIGRRQKQQQQERQEQREQEQQGHRERHSGQGDADAERSPGAEIVASARSPITDADAERSPGAEAVDVATAADPPVRRDGYVPLDVEVGAASAATSSSCGASCGACCDARHGALCALPSALCGLVGALRRLCTPRRSQVDNRLLSLMRWDLQCFLFCAALFILLVLNIARAQLAQQAVLATAEIRSLSSDQISQLAEPAGRRVAEEAGSGGALGALESLDAHALPSLFNASLLSPHAVEQGLSAVQAAVWSMAPLVTLLCSGDFWGGWRIEVAFHMCRMLYAASAVPFLFFMLPIINGLLSHTLPTGYNPRGECVLLESTGLTHMNTWLRGELANPQVRRQLSDDEARQIEQLLDESEKADERLLKAPLPVRNLKQDDLLRRLERIVGRGHPLYPRFHPDLVLCDEYEAAAKAESRARRTAATKEARARLAEFRGARAPHASASASRGTAGCALCARSFGPFRWRQHCRSCDRPVCGECARALRVTQHGRERVCDECVLRAGADEPEGGPGESSEVRGEDGLDETSEVAGEAVARRASSVAVGPSVQSGRNEE